MDNVKYIRQFLMENVSIRRLVLNGYPNETIKLPPPYLGFREKYGNKIFECFSFKYFKTWEVRVYTDYTCENHPNVFAIFEPYSVTSYKYTALITDDENIFKEKEDAYSSCNNDDELEMAKDIVAYIKAGVQQYYHKKEKENNG